MKVVILCGGKGSRIRDSNELLPKPMLPIGEKPILWHIMKIYTAHGFTDFVLCLGHKGWLIKEFFLNYRPMTSDCTVTLGRHPEIEFHDHFDEALWKVTLAETGEETMTGGRVHRIRRYVDGDDCFCLTYGDGVADVDLKGLVEHHIRSGLVGTVTATRVAGRFGELDIEEGIVSCYNEKPAVTTGRINAGFMIFDSKRIWDYFDDRPELVLERDVFNRIVADRQLGVYYHDGYWQCMDTPRELALLNDLWKSEKAPWKIW